MQGLGQFDVIIAGGGLAGAVLADQLSARGWSVAVVERGGQAAADPPARASLAARVKARLRPGTANLFLPDRYRGRLAVHSGGESSPATIRPAVLGQGLGGSSIVYGAALGRMRRADFEADTRGPDAVGAAENRWPFGYDELLPHYRRAEAYMQVHGTPDPLDPDDDSSLPSPPPLSPRDAGLVTHLQANGCHPFRLHAAMQYRPGCSECQGVICQRGCKSDGWSRALAGAVGRPNLMLLQDHVVRHVTETEGGITATITRADGTETTLDARLAVLTAGALNTPQIIARSSPPGGGAHSPALGCYLMFHVSDMFAVFPTSTAPAQFPLKSLSIRDFYQQDGQALGEIQSMGMQPATGMIADFLKGEARGLGLGWAGPALELLRIPAMFAERLFRPAALFATILEDLPYAANRVWSAPGDDDIHISYGIADELQRRAGLMRRAIGTAFRPCRVFFLTRLAQPNLGHPLGTCRMGEDRQTSVTSRDGQVHGWDRLFVADGSLFPSSGGVNPSLTIVANALRIAQTLQSRLAS